MKVTVPVTFNGEVEVDVPDRLPKEDQLALALQLALYRCTVVTSGNDTPEADAFPLQVKFSSISHVAE